jgi:hypothetical protein
LEKKEKDASSKEAEAIDREIEKNMKGKVGFADISFRI